LYRLIEALQRIDDALRSEQARPRPDWRRLMRLARLKFRVKALIHRFTRKTVRV